MKGILFVLAFVIFNIIIGLSFKSNVHQETTISLHPILNEAFYSDKAEGELIEENHFAEEQQIIQERFDSCIHYLVSSLDNKYLSDFEKGHGIYLEIKSTYPNSEVLDFLDLIDFEKLWMEGVLGQDEEIQKVLKLKI